MLCLNKGLFKPMTLLISMVALPIQITCIVFAFFDDALKFICVFLIMALCYVAAIYGVWRYSKSQKCYMRLDQDAIILHSPYIKSTADELIVKLENAVMFEYYKLSSVRAWLMLENYVLPQCIYLTYIQDDQEHCKHIGYVSLKDIELFCSKIDVPLIIK